MENTKSLILPCILNALSTRPNLCETVENLARDIKDYIDACNDDGEPEISMANVRKYLNEALNVGQRLGVFTVTDDNTIRMPFNFRQHGDYAITPELRTQNAVEYDDGANAEAEGDMEEEEQMSRSGKRSQNAGQYEDANVNEAGEDMEEEDIEVENIVRPRVSQRRKKSQTRRHPHELIQNAAMSRRRRTSARRSGAARPSRRTRVASRRRRQAPEKQRPRRRASRRRRHASPTEV
ncbi:uncharacterized protein isoform X2 [Musca autumnalis]|uniref:uncharacterized protein isoform X2 n=1 Tax=Musca autumnalis TaxID=221902 RepID=UPI003CE84895